MWWQRPCSGNLVVWILILLLPSGRRITFGKSLLLSWPHFLHPPNEAVGLELLDLSPIISDLKQDFKTLFWSFLTVNQRMGKWHVNTGGTKWKIPLTVVPETHALLHFGFTCCGLYSSSLPSILKRQGCHYFVCNTMRQQWKFKEEGLCWEDISERGQESEGLHYNHWLCDLGQVI